MFVCRAAETDEELQACAVLRARAFYVYPPERAFAGQARSACHAGCRFRDLLPAATTDSFLIDFTNGGSCYLGMTLETVLSHPWRLG